MKLSEFLRGNERRQAFGALTDGDAACAVAQIFEQAFVVPVDRVGIARARRLLRSTLVLDWQSGRESGDSPVGGR